MKLAEVRYCYDSQTTYLKSMQFAIQNISSASSRTQPPLVLGVLGTINPSMDLCSTWKLELKQKVARIEVYYDSS